MSLQPGNPAAVPAVGAGLGMALGGDHPDDLPGDGRTGRDDDGSPVGRADADADARRASGDAPDSARERAEEQVVNEEALDAFVARDQE